jgi:ABC-type dipeptide/oligopeptide/nickel transport system permease subunit
VIALWFLVGIAALCFSSPLLTALHLLPDYKAQDLALGPVAPCAAHWLGTDLLGRDLLARLLQGGMISISVGLIATTVALFVGVIYGVVAAEIGGRFEDLAMRVVDIVSTLPLTLIVILCTVIFGQNIWMIFLAVGGVSWLTMARIVRGQVLSLKERQFVTAARALGQSHTKILTRHLLPNLAGIILVYLTLTIPAVVIDESFLSFLGLGIQAPQASWGSLLADGAGAINPLRSFWWLLVFPAAAMSLTLLALNFLGDALRDAFDTRGR